MKNSIVLVFAIIANLCSAQSGLGEYSFIEVPERFEFVKGDNTYQLSDMMVYYFEKKGIKAYRNQDSPNVPKCDALYADVEKGTSVLNTRLYILLKDCSDNVVFKSEAGKSKVKSYAKAFPDALRMAFKTFTKKDIKIPEGNIVKTPVSIEEPLFEDKIDIIQTQKIPKVDEPIVSKVINVAPVTSPIPLVSFSNYTLNGSSYLLKKGETGFTLFLTKEGTDDFIKVGDISMNQDATFTMKDLYGENKTGRFNKNLDIVIDLSNGTELVYLKVL